MERRHGDLEVTNGHLAQEARDALVKNLLSHKVTKGMIRRRNHIFDRDINSDQVLNTLIQIVPNRSVGGIGRLLASWTGNPKNRSGLSPVAREIRGALERSKFEIPEGY